MTIDWLSFLVVVVAAVVASCIVVMLFATAIRLLATPPRDATGTGAARDEEMDDVAPATRPRAATAAAAALFSLASVAALYGIYLIIPALHR